MTSPASGPAPALEARGIVKTFPGVVANDDVDFDVRVGEIHALLGENGAGKSTLVNILAGLYRPDAGQVLLDGAPVAFGSPREAIAAGIGMVHQHFTLVPSQTVTENVLLGLKTPRFLLRPEALGGGDRARWPSSSGCGWIRARRSGSCRWASSSASRSSRCSIAAPASSSWTSRRRSWRPRRWIELERTLRSMTLAGRSIIFISHKLVEVLAIADRITVMRRGKVTAAGIPAAGTTKADLASRMVGRSVIETLERTPFQPGPVVLSVKDVYADGDRGLPALRGVTLDVRAGEIVGIAAVAGNGQTELAQVITAMRRLSRQRHRRRVEVANGSAGHAIALGHRPCAGGPDGRRQLRRTCR